ncbi:MAG TPA: GFA family protein [Polyangia bacterium]
MSNHNIHAASLSQHHGRCHCGDVTYAVVVDPTQGSRCNCSVCTKLGVTTSIVKPEAFTLLSDEATLASFSRFPEIANRFFCKRCHVFLFSKGHLEEVGGDFVSVNLNTLDDFDPLDVTVVHWDGRHNNWSAGPRPTPWPVHSGARTAEAA